MLCASTTENASMKGRSPNAAASEGVRQKIVNSQLMDEAVISPVENAGIHTYVLLRPCPLHAAQPQSHHIQHPLHSPNKLPAASGSRLI